MKLSLRNFPLFLARLLNPTNLGVRNAPESSLTKDRRPPPLCHQWTDFVLLGLIIPAVTAMGWASVSGV